VQRADRAREAELAALWRRFPDLEPEARDAIEGMTRHLADRLLREPLERLGRDADGRDGRAIRDIFAL
jgi:glutamyl-tRNA reductase